MLDNHSFEMLVMAQTDALYRVSMAMLKNEHDAQDAVHEAILRAFEKRSQLRQEQYFGAWLMRILINECKKTLRRRRRYADIGDALPDIASRDNPYLSVEIGEVIDRLPEKLRLTVLLFYVEDYSVKDISNILHIPDGTVKSRLNKARTLLRESLKDTV